MASPTVSVLVPTYKYARYLPEALDSILSQDYSDFELIVTDDNSEDGTEEILRRYERLDDRVQGHVHGDRQGMVANWNDCLRRARGRYIKYVFADDRLVTPDALGRMVERIERHPQAALVACAREIIDDRSRPIAVTGFAPFDVLKSGRDVVTEWVSHLENRIGEPTAVLFRRRDAGRGFDPAYRQLVDFEMWLHLLKNGDLAYIADCLCSFRKHDSQQSEHNRVQRVGEREQPLLLSDYGRDVLDSGSDRALFELRYRASKLRPGPQRERLLSLAAGRWNGRPMRYLEHYVRYKLRRPVENLRRAMWKRAAFRRIAGAR